jgi:DNA-binding CsgD family transcriptional regulator
MRLTFREKEILAVLKKEPLISQDELANRFGITRSSVAVHISNLMKKGVILGKGYVFTEQVSIVVVGKSFLRIDITEAENIIINAQYGGFALETSRAFADLGVNIKIITIIGNDELGTDVLSELQAKDIDISNVYRHPQKRSCRRVYVNGRVKYEEGFSTGDYEKTINAREWVVFNCNWLVIEPGFQENLIKKAMSKNEEKLPYFCSHRFLTFPEEIPEYLFKYFVVILGVKDPQDVEFYVKEVADRINDNQNFIITDGNTKVVYFNNRTATDFPLLPNQCFDSKSNLSFLLAGIIYGLSYGYPIRQVIRMGVGTASSN